MHKPLVFTGWWLIKCEFVLLIILILSFKSSCRVIRLFALHISSTQNAVEYRNMCMCVGLLLVLIGTTFARRRTSIKWMNATECKRVYKMKSWLFYLNWRFKWIVFMSGKSAHQRTEATHRLTQTASTFKNLLFATITAIHFCGFSFLFCWYSETSKNYTYFRTVVMCACCFSVLIFIVCLLFFICTSYF